MDVLNYKVKHLYCITIERLEFKCSVYKLSSLI